MDGHPEAANLDTFAGMLGHFGVTLPAGAQDVRFQIVDDSTWNSGTTLSLYLHDTLPAASVPALLAHLHASPDSSAGVGFVGEDGTNLGDDWPRIATYVPADAPDDAGPGWLKAYTWTADSGFGTVFVDTRTSTATPGVYLAAGSHGY